MGEIALKYLSILIRKIWNYGEGSKKRHSLGREKEKRKRSLRLTMIVAVCFVGLCLYGLAFPHTGAHHSSQSASSSTSSQTSVNDTSTMGQIGKNLTLKSSAGATLTPYPNGGNHPLSSASVDEQTKNQAYMHAAGNGGLAHTAHQSDVSIILAQLSPSKANDSCSPQVGGGGQYGVPGYINDPNYSGCDTSVGNDFLIGKSGGQWSGALFRLDSKFTVENPIVQNLLALMAGIAAACVVPLIAFTGFRVMTGAITMRFANALESLPRLLFGVIGAGMALPLAQAVLQIAEAMSLLVVNAVGDQGIQITSIIYPASSWGPWLDGLLIIGVTLVVILPIVAQIEFLGTSAGAWAAIPIAITLIGVLWGEMYNFVLVIFSIFLAGQVFIRIILIDFYVILSPIAMVAAGLSGEMGVKFTRDWLLGFAGLVASQFAQVAVLVIGLIVMKQYNGANNDIMTHLMQVGTVILMLRVPGIFKTSATSLVAQIGPAVGGAVTGEYTQFIMR